MPDEPERPEGDPKIEELDGLGEPGPGALSAKERFRKASHIGLLMSYDLIDKLRFWERETLQLPDDEVEERLGHLVRSVERLRTAYLEFADIDL